MIELRDYQKDIARKAAVLLRKYGIAYLSMECRTGKTITALETARLYSARRVLIITKKKAIPSIQKDYLLMQNETALYSLDAINFESAKKVSGVYDLIIIDEAHSLGAYPKPSKRTIAIKEICKGKPVLFLSGTPSPESYSQLFHQFWVSEKSPFAAYKNFYKWAHDFVDIKQRKINGCIMNDYSKAYKAQIDNHTSHLFLTYTQKEAGFSSNINEHDVFVQLNDIAKNAIREVFRNSIYSLEQDVVLGDTPAKKLTKLHQLSSGTVITENHKPIILDTSKAQYIQDHFAGKKLAIFYVYDAEFEVLRNYFLSWTDSPEEFQESKDKTFICQVRRAREGVRLDSADALVFYNFEYSYLSYEQGRNRLVSKERERPVDVYFLCSDAGIEKDILSAVRQKKDFTMSYYNRLHSYEGDLFGE